MSQQLGIQQNHPLMYLSDVSRYLTKYLCHLACGALLLALSFSACAAVSESSIPTRVVTQAFTANGNTASFPVHGPATQVTLPDDWSVSRPQYEGYIWYRVNYDPPPGIGDNEILALYIGRVCSNLEVFLNGHRIFSGGRMSTPVARNCHRPQLVRLPAALLKARNNALDLKVRGYALEHVSSSMRAAGLSKLRIGPLSKLSASWRVVEFWSVTAAKIAAVVLVVLGMLMIAGGWFHRGSSYLLCFGLLAVGSAALTAHLWVSELPVANVAVEMAICSAYAPLVGLGVMSMVRFVKMRLRWIEVLLILQCLLFPALLWVGDSQRLYSTASAWYWVLVLEVLAAAVVCLRVCWWRQRTEFWFLIEVVLLLVLLHALEVALRGPTAMPQSYVPQFALPLLAMAICLRQVQVFARTLRVAEVSRATLESRIQEATVEVERNFAQLAELRVEQVTAKERKRIAADLHDDLGAKLLTIVHTSESESISTLAREALEEMRLSVRSLTAKPMKVTDAFADWRAETVSRLGQAGIEVEWGSAIEDANQLISARGFVQTTRILREAVNNIIKHSAASQCDVSCTVGEGELALVVQDNGRGIPLELDGKLDRGHGMSSMKHRAKQMQGQCLVESGPGYGTAIRLTLPL